MPNLTNSQKLIEEVGLKAYRSELGRAAFTNDFHDLDNIPGEAVVNNSTIYFQKNGVQFDSTTTNAVNDKTINIIMTKADVGLGNVDNTSDADKPISNATQAVLSTKANASNVYTKGETDAAITAAISSVYRYKGSVLNYNALPTSGMVAGDVYNVESEHVVDPKFAAGTNVAWTGSAWDPLSGALAVDGGTAVMTLTQEQYDALPSSEKESNTIFLIEGDGPGGEITVKWNNITGKPDVMINPINGQTGQVLTKTASGYTWAAAQGGSNVVELTQAQYDNLTPEEKAADVVYLIQGEAGTLTIAWSNITDKPDVMIVPANGSTGQVLTKTANGYEWADGSSQTVKLTQAQYDALPAAQKQADIIYLITGTAVVPVVAMKMTQAQYDALTPEEKNADVIYLITGTPGTLTIAWENVTNKPDVMVDPAPGNTGDVLTKTASGYEWAPAQGGGASGPVSINYTEIKQWSDEIASAGQSSSLSYTPQHDGWLMVKWQDNIWQGKLIADMSISGTLWGSSSMPGTSIYHLGSSDYKGMTMYMPHYEYVPVKANQTITITMTINNDSSFSPSTSGYQQFCIWGFMYYEI